MKNGITITYLPNFPERPTNPARCNIKTGQIEINARRWKELSPETKDFVLQHEIGHYKYHTFDEVKADQYALSQLALQKPYSLRDYLNSVNEVSYGNPKRVNQAKLDVLQIAAENGSEEAKMLLGRYAAADGKERSKHVFLGVFIVFAILCLIILKIKKNG